MKRPTDTEEHLTLCPLAVPSGANTICTILLSRLILLIPSAMLVFFVCVLAVAFSDSATDLFSPGHLLPLVD